MERRQIGPSFRPRSERDAAQQEFARLGPLALSRQQDPEFVGAGKVVGVGGERGLMKSDRLGFFSRLLARVGLTEQGMQSAECKQNLGGARIVSPARALDVLAGAGLVRRDRLSRGHPFRLLGVEHARDVPLGNGRDIRIQPRAGPVGVKVVGLVECAYGALQRGQTGLVAKVQVSALSDDGQGIEEFAPRRGCRSLAGENLSVVQVGPGNLLFLGT